MKRLIRLFITIILFSMPAGIAWGDSEIFMAVREGDLEKINRLIRLDPRVANARSVNRTRPMHWAAAYGNIEIIQLLLEHGADVSASTVKGATPLMMAAAGGHIEAVRILGVRDADVNTATRKGWTALHFGAFNGSLSVVQFLLDLGAEVNSRTRDGKTPLVLALEREHGDIVRLIRETGGVE